MENEGTVKWARDGKPELAELKELLAYARQNYVAHTDWYLRHRDAGIKLLGIALLANVTIGGLYFDDKLPACLAILALGVLASLSVVLAFLAIRSCHQSYSASLEHAAMVSKIVWAMGFGQAIGISASCSLTKCPAWEDPYPYVPRYLDDALTAPDTETFVSIHTEKPWTTYFTVKWTLVILCLASCLIALFLIVAIGTGLECS